MSLERIEKKLRETKFFLARMREMEKITIGDREPFDFFLSAFLNAAETVNNVVMGLAHGLAIGRRTVSAPRKTRLPIFSVRTGVAKPTIKNGDRDEKPALSPFHSPNTFAVPSFIHSLFFRARPSSSPLIITRLCKTSDE